MINNNEKWDHRFLALSQHISLWSKDPSTKVGSVIVDAKRRVVSCGYNGLPQGVEDSPERLNNRDIKYKIIVHAERNAIIFSHIDLNGMTLYVWPLMPCATCASLIIQSGINRVVAPISNNPRWIDDFSLTKQLFKESSITLDLIDINSLSFLSHEEKSLWI